MQFLRSFDWFLISSLKLILFLRIKENRLKWSLVFIPSDFQLNPILRGYGKCEARNANDRLPN